MKLKQRNKSLNKDHFGGETLCSSQSVSKSSKEKPASHGGLINIGALFETTHLRDRLDRSANVHCVDPDFSHSEIILSMIGLISVGKPDYDAIEIFRSKPEFFMKALGLSEIPPRPTIRQPLDLIGRAAEPDVTDKSTSPSITPLDMSVFNPCHPDVFKKTLKIKERKK